MFDVHLHEISPHFKILSFQIVKPLTIIHFLPIFVCVLIISKLSYYDEVFLFVFMQNVLLCRSVQRASCVFDLSCSKTERPFLRGCTQLWRNHVLFLYTVVSSMSKYQQVICMPNNIDKVLVCTITL